jgi:hypothetical protein
MVNTAITTVASACKELNDTAQTNLAELLHRTAAPDNLVTLENSIVFHYIGKQVKTGWTCKSCDKSFSIRKILINTTQALLDV